jgi:hypothetical protein
MNSVWFGFEFTSYKDWTEEDWANAMYSDDSTFQCIQSFKTKVRRPSGSQLLRPQLQIQDCEAPDSVMV